MATTTETKELIRSIEDAVNNRDSDAIADIYAEDFVFHRELENLHGLGFNDYLEASTMRSRTSRSPSKK